ncbi:MAG: glycosyltransferase family 2 protein [Planctomycetota bacterium]
MIIWYALLGTGLFFSLLALVMTWANLRVYQPTEPLAKAPKIGEHDDNEKTPFVSVCVPARNEEANLEHCVRSILKQDFKSFEVLVYDDGSEDKTPQILRALSELDDRVIAVRTETLPDGWNGKQHACWQMSRHARGRWMLFTDADVRFEPSALRRALAFAEASKAGLVSTFPRQITKTPSESLIVPMIFFVLFSYLPMMLMRRRPDPGLCAACGQFILARRDAYEKAGSHSAVRDSMHEGVKLPRLVRKAGFHTDLFDGTDLCSVRMYEGLGQTWRGFTKNAYEGLGSIGLLVFFTVVHAVAHIVPWLAAVWLIVAVSLGAMAWQSAWLLGALAGGSILAQLVQRAMLAKRLGTPAIGIWLHPVGVIAMTLIQWHSLLLELAGARTWRGRTQGSSTAG